MRRGLLADFDPNKMLAGEWAVTIDANTKNQIVYMCFAAGIVKRMGTLDDFEDWFKLEMKPYEIDFAAIRQDCIDLRDQMIVIRDTLIPAAQIALKIPDLVDEAEAYRDETKGYKEFVENAVNLNIPTMFLDTVTGLLSYDGGKIDFTLDQTTGNLCWDLV